MRLATLFTIVSSIAVTAVQAQTTTEPITGILGNATTVDDNPEGVVFMARLPNKEFHDPKDPRGNVKGMIMATAAPGGKGTMFTVNFSNLPTSGGPFVYHIHVAPVPGNGNCTSTLGHLDPFIRGETPACDKSQPETCQVGDLSGKYGKIESDPFSVTFVDPFTSTLEGPGSFFGNRSFVIHFANKTRISCANFEEVGASSNSCSSTSSSTTSTYTNGVAITSAGAAPTSVGTIAPPASTIVPSSPAIFTGAAASGVATPVFAFLGAAAAALLL